MGKRRSVIHLAQINKNGVADNIWGTPIDDRFEKNAHPLHTFQDACKTFKIKPKIDVCAEASNSKCEKFFSVEQDGLKQEWRQDFYGNFPYSEVAKWIEKAYIQHLKWNVNGLILCFSKTETKWWHSYVQGKAEVHFVKKRINFWKNGKIPIKSTEKNPKPHSMPAPYPSCWLIFRKEKEFWERYYEDQQK